MKSVPTIEELRDLAAIDLEIEYEDDLDYRGNFTNDNGKRDTKIERWITRELIRGNEWAWCRVTVRASYDGAHGYDHLGGCSYESRAAFVVPDGYYPDMVTQALTCLRAELIERARQWVTVKVDAARVAPARIAALILHIQDLDSDAARVEWPS